MAKRTPKSYSIQVGPFNWAVRFVSESEADNGGYEGRCDGGSHTILLARDLHKTRLLVTKLHEYLHAVEFVYNFDLGEEKVHLIATALAQILRGRVDPDKV